MGEEHQNLTHLHLMTPLINMLFIPRICVGKAPAGGAIAVSSVEISRPCPVWSQYYQPCQSSGGNKSVVNLLSGVGSLTFWRCALYQKFIRCRYGEFLCVCPCESHSLLYGWHHSLAPKWDFSDIMNLPSVLASICFQLPMEPTQIMLNVLCYCAPEYLILLNYQ